MVDVPTGPRIRIIHKIRVSCIDRALGRSDNICSSWELVAEPDWIGGLSLWKLGDARGLGFVSRI